MITGVADDDPSGISTYSIAGATFGYLPLWTALFSFPLMTAVQLMCARLGLVTGLGLAGVIRRRYSRWVLWGACALLVVANVINIAADLGGMAEATMMVTGVPVALMVPFFGIVIVVLLMWSSYRTIARVFKWLTLVLLAYVATAFVAHVDWRAALTATLVPRIELSRRNDGERRAPVSGRKGRSRWSITVSVCISVTPQGSGLMCPFPDRAINRARTRSASFCANSRGRMSPMPAGAAGTMNLIGFDG